MKRAVGIILLNRKTGEILMGKRSSKSPQPNTWATFGGKVEEGETCEQAARREFYEEAGVDYQDELHEIDCQSEGNFRFVYYLGLVDSSPEVKINKEHSSYCWHPLSKLYRGQFSPTPNTKASAYQEVLHSGFKKAIPTITPIILNKIKSLS